MTRDQAIGALSYLVDKYIESASTKQRLIEIMANPTLVDIPVRGVLHEILEAGAKVCAEDEDMVSELVFSFG